MALWPGNFKAAFRGGKCALQLGRYELAASLAQGGLEVAPENGPLAKLLAQARAGVAKLGRQRAAAVAARETAAARLGVAASACGERGIRVGGPLFRDMRRAADEPHLTEDGCMHWPLVLLYPQSGHSDYVQAWPEVESVGALVSALLPQRRGAAPPLPWDAAGAYTADNVDVFYVRNIVPERPLARAWEEWLPPLPAASAAEGAPAPAGAAGSAEEAAAKPGTGGPPQWVRIPLHAPLLLPLVQPDHVVPEIPVLYVVARGTPWHGLWAADALRGMKAAAFPELAVPALPTREEFDAAQAAEA